MRFLYSLLLTIAAPFLLFNLYRRKPGKPNVGKRWIEHFGFAPKFKKPHPIWIHAVSVGEVIAAKPIIFALRKKYPDYPILVTTTTATGAAIVNQLGDDIEHRYMPIDFSFAITLFLTRINPKILLIMETELWPNTLAAVKKAAIPIIVINARLSQRSMQRYQKVQPIFSILSQNITHIICQFNADATRFKTLGINASRLSVSGSIKFDLPVFDPFSFDVIALKEQMAGRPVWIAASTHFGEDEILLEVHQSVLDRHPNALLILVPRHPERFLDVAALARSHDFSVTRRSQRSPISSKTQIYLADTMGEMMTLFSVSDLCFMGGSLLGKKVGGHNLLEPASLGKALLIGPSFYNFQAVTEQLIERGACQICFDKNDITSKIIALLENPAQRARASEAALCFVKQNRGAVDKTLSIIAPWLQLKS